MTARYEEFPFPGLPSIHELTDESNACEHDCLPFDRNKPPECRCWNIRWRAPAEVVPLPVKQRAAHGHRFPVHVRRRAVQLYREGLSLEAAGGRVGACRNSVRAWVVEAGVEVRGRWAA